MHSWRKLWQRSLEHVTDKYTRLFKEVPHEWGKGPTPVITLANFKHGQNLDEYIVGCDSDIGGISVAGLDRDDEGFGRFHGRLSTQFKTDLRMGRQRVVRSGYAGFRSVERKTVFGIMTWDTRHHTFLHIRLRNMIQTPSRFFLNLQTDGPDAASLYQHKLYMKPTSEWQDVLIPFHDFTLTRKGEIAINQIGMYREKVKTVGISVLGPGEGPFDLRLAAIRACSSPTEIGPETPPTPPDPASVTDVR